MQRSYLVKSPVHFADYGFFVKVGDILVHDSSNANRLTVYRNGEVVKAVKQTSLGLAAMQKSGFIEEVIQAARVAPKAPQKPVDAPKPAPKPTEPKKPSQEELEIKRKKAQPTEVKIDDVPRLKEALAKREEPKPAPKKEEPKPEPKAKAVEEIE
jgi:hypothetical protein